METRKVSVGVKISNNNLYTKGLNVYVDVTSSQTPALVGWRHVANSISGQPDKGYQKSLETDINLVVLFYLSNGLGF